jgi:hypothetical protein
MDIPGSFRLVYRAAAILALGRERLGRSLGGVLRGKPSKDVESWSPGMGSEVSIDGENVGC